MPRTIFDDFNLIPWFLEKCVKTHVSKKTQQDLQITQFSTKIGIFVQKMHLLVLMMKHRNFSKMRGFY